MQNGASGTANELPGSGPKSGFAGNNRVAGRRATRQEESAPCQYNAGTTELADLLDAAGPVGARTARGAAHAGTNCLKQKPSAQPGRAGHSPIKFLASIAHHRRLPHPPASKAGGATHPEKPPPLPSAHTSVHLRSDPLLLLSYPASTVLPPWPRAGPQCVGGCRPLYTAAGVGTSLQSSGLSEKVHDVNCQTLAVEAGSRLLSQAKPQ